MAIFVKGMSLVSRGQHQGLSRAYGITGMMSSTLRVIRLPNDFCAEAVMGGNDGCDAATMFQQCGDDVSVMFLRWVGDVATRQQRWVDSAVRSRRRLHLLYAGCVVFALALGAVGNWSTG
jgi:hypothetical protein